MIVYVVIIALFILVGIRFQKSNDMILGLKDTTIINGVCTLFIFLSHSTQYWHLSDNILDSTYKHVQNFHNQWVVAPFFAFSGYGVMHSIMNKGSDYIRSYPYKRLISTLVNFDVAVIMYLILAEVIKSDYSIITILGAFVGITSIGNSNWYIFAILIMYSISYIAARTTNDLKKQVIFIFACTMLYYFVMQLLEFEDRFFSTIMCYPFGVLLALYKEELVIRIKHNKFFVLFILSILIIITYKLRFNVIVMNFSSIVFVSLILWFLCFFEIKSKFLHFFGKYAFGIFVLQRIPGIILSNYIEVEGVTKHLLLLFDLIITVIITLLYVRILSIINEKLIAKMGGKQRNES